MAAKQSRRHCKDCGRKTLHEKQYFSLALGIILSLLTAGIFIPFWGFIMLRDAVQSWRCQICGKTRVL
jgi:hypothetical protein